MSKRLKSAKLYKKKTICQICSKTDLVLALPPSSPLAPVRRFLRSCTDTTPIERRGFSPGKKVLLLSLIYIFTTPIERRGFSPGKKHRDTFQLKIFILSAIEFLHKKFGKYLQPGGESGDLTGVVTGELPPKYFESFLDKYLFFSRCANFYFHLYISNLSKLSLSLSSCKQRVSCVAFDRLTNKPGDTSMSTLMDRIFRTLFLP